MTARQDPIVMVPHDPQWSTHFERERERLEKGLAPWLVTPIEHIGSTAVVGLVAKPIIDMLALVVSYVAFADALPVLVRMGWVSVPEPGDGTARRWSFCFPDAARRTHHLHVVEYTSTGWRSWVAFRDHLRMHPAVTSEYGRIKSALAAADDRDRPAYRTGKAPFIRAVLKSLDGG
jgi:GrpB-like predicted nucleotidyltransferase (UPF0157 family)